MNNYKLYSTIENTVLFEGRFSNFKECLERAVQSRITLKNINLRNKNLSNFNLDDALMPGADFTGSNLSGANMSEAYLKDSNFTETSLYNTCFYDSNLSACNFEDASFGATDIHGSIISQAQFSTLSCFTLDFSHARHMGGCTFTNPDGQVCEMSRPPVVIHGMGNKPIILMDKHVKAGHNIIDHKRLDALAEKLSAHALQKRISA